MATPYKGDIVLYIQTPLKKLLMNHWPEFIDIWYGTFMIDQVSYYQSKTFMMHKSSIHQRCRSLVLETEEIRPNL